jgi:peptide/nickel transport system ATP-binding protein
MSDRLLEVTSLRVSFRTEDGVVNAVDDVSFHVDAGEVLAIVGESGCGKSVTGMTLMGLTRSPNARFHGRALFAGKDLVTATDDEMRVIRGAEIAMVFQDPMTALNPVQRIGKQLVEQIRAHEELDRDAATERARALLERVGIPRPGERLRAFPHELSGGMRQRVMIAMALSCDPCLLIADEPTTALDVTIQAQILEEVRQLREETNAGVILITHDLGVVAEIADIIAVMYAGRIVEHAPAEQIFGAPQHPYTWGLLKSIPRLDTPRNEELVPISGRPPSLIRRPGGCFFHPRCPYARESHTRIDPKREPVPGDPGHEVACLLEPDLRARLWKRLVAGESPDVLKREVAAASATPLVATEPASGTPGVEP